MAPPSILIVGCGIAGPVLATFLLSSPEQSAHEKPHVTVLERATPSQRTKGQNIDIRGAGLTIIRKLGLESAIRSAVTGEEGVLMVDASNRTWSKNPADRTGKYETGTADVEIMRGRLADICYQRSRAVSDEVKREGGGGVEYVFGDTLDELEQDGEKVQVRFGKNGERRTFDVVVGADGLHSRTRRLVFGEAGDEGRVKRLGMYCGFFSMQKAETDSKWRRWYHAPGRRSIMTRPSDQGDRTSALLSVVDEKDQRLEEVAAMGPRGVEAQKALLKEYFRDVGWEGERVLGQMEASNDFYYDMVAQVKMDKWSKGRVVLLGDAGYCASPISGMGTTLAFQGAYNLAGALVQHPRDYTAAFAQYSEQMLPIVERAQELPLGGRAPHVIHRETWWGILILRMIVAFIYWSGLGTLVLILARSKPASAIPVQDYGFKRMPEWQEESVE